MDSGQFTTLLAKWSRGDKSALKALIPIVYAEFKAQIIELKYFGGLNGEEIAEVLNVSLSTVTRDIRMAEAWLQRYLTRNAAPAEKPK